MEDLKNQQVIRQGDVSVFLTPSGEDQLYLTASLGSNAESTSGSAIEAYSLIADVLDSYGLTTVHERIHGSLSVADEVLEARRAHRAPARSRDSGAPERSERGPCRSLHAAARRRR